MRVAVYSGSFNPLHIGHLAILKRLVQAGYEKVYLIVSPKNPLKDTIDPDTSDERYEAAVNAIDRHPELNGRVVADDIELTMPSPQYTIRTLRALSAREPGNRFTLVIGADNLHSLRRWREWDSILSDFGVAVYPREGFDIREDRSSIMLQWAESGNPEKPYLIEILDAPMVTISSTAIREGTAAGKDMSSFLM